jgi:mannose-6-phosphate isomerase-like protein (cupin superfamily)
MFSKVSEYWTPKILAEMNDYQFKIAKIKGEFIWHNHKKTDEAFIIIEGSMKIALNDRIINLSEGDLYIVPKGVEHKPFADKECKIMLIELKGTQNTGEKTHRLTAENNQWI